MADYRTPDVYVEEKSVLPPSVAEVSTAIPAFLGYTEKGFQTDPATGWPVPVRISSMLEYTNTFGGAKPLAVEVCLAPDDSILEIKPEENGTNYMMYYNLDMYFRNGGGPCYVISVGEYGSGINDTDFHSGLSALGKEDEPTLIVMTEATLLTDLAKYGALLDAAMKQCYDLKDRFLIADVPDNASAEAFRNAINSKDELKYGAAYTPSIVTTLTPNFADAQVTVSGIGTIADERSQTFPEKSNDGIRVVYKETDSTNEAAAPKVKLLQKDSDSTPNDVSFSIDGDTLTIYGLKAPDDPDTDPDPRKASNIKAKWDAWTGADTDWSLDLTGSTGNAIVEATGSKVHYLKVSSGTISTLASLKDTKTGVYNAAKALLEKHRVVLPPSGAVAGIYARVDNQRGVWKAPANVGVVSSSAPTKKITNAEQDGLNIDPGSGKSINAIRAFSGKGMLVWGARTLAGNDNEWRYVPVRRLFNLVEESLKKATGFAVFEPNTPTTWLKVRGLIDSYLYGLWQQGALAGATQDQAYFINVGLGQTMTEQDILEGRMIVEIGLAAVRPAEFIVLRFSHKLQQG